VSVQDAGRPAHTRLVWVARVGERIRLLADGDSEMQILNGDIATALARYHVTVTSVAKPSTGLTNPSLFDWQAAARRQAATVQPDVSVVFIGANDGFATRDGGHVEACCGAAWSAGYAALVARMAAALLRGNAGRVYWYLLPAPRPANFHALFDAVNAGIRGAAARFPGRLALLDADGFFTPGDRYRNYMVLGGHGFTIHEADGIHLSASADPYAAGLLVQAMLHDDVIR
jgi:hypothetical protein